MLTLIFVSKKIGNVFTKLFFIMYISKKNKNELITKVCS